MRWDRAYGSYVPAAVVGEFVQYCARFAIDEVAKGAAQLKAKSRTKVAVIDRVRSRISAKEVAARWRVMRSIQEEARAIRLRTERHITGI